MAEDYEELVRQSKGNVVDIILRKDDWQNELIEFLDAYGGEDNRSVIICGNMYNVRIIPEGDVAVKLVLVKVVRSGEVWWKKAEKTSKTADEFKAEWLAYLAENNIPLHDPGKEIKEVKPFSIIE